MPELLHTQLSLPASADEKHRHYTDVFNDIKAVLADESNWVAAMSTVSSMLHHAFEYYHWTGFYCVWPEHIPSTVVVGPYQGTLGCLRIPLDKGLWGSSKGEDNTART